MKRKQKDWRFEVKQAEKQLNRANRKRTVYGRDGELREVLNEFPPDAFEVWCMAIDLVVQRDIESMMPSEIGDQQ